MKTPTLPLLLLSSLLITPTTHAGSNNGYTTAANVYTGSSSRSWFGGGTAYAIAQWKAERQAATPSPAENQQTTTDAEQSPSQTPEDTP